MAENKGFNLAAALGEMSELNTAAEQIVLLDLDRIDPDPDNFYSLDGIEALAGNIELIGLQQPLRVRPNGLRYTVVSGHRRRAAIQLIRDGGSEQFKAGVPCIVEYGEASEAMRKLRLIYANAATRVMTSAELSRQAEEVTRLLYELKEQGVEFPGRMRDHVAEACKVSASKLARLHAIRENLIPEILAAYDEGKVNEDAAYQLSRFPEDLQQAVAARMAQPRVTRWPSGTSLQAVRKDLDLYKGMSCPARAGESCRHLQEKILHNMFSWDWEFCRPDKCCLECAKAGRSCGFMCKAGHERIKLDKAVEAEKRKNQLADAKSREEIAQKRIREKAARLVALADRAGLSDGARLMSWGHSIGELRRVAAGSGGPVTERQVEPYSFADAREWCQKLKCSMSELAGEAVEEPNTATDEVGDKFIYFAWRIGLPPSNMPGWYAAKVQIFQTDLVVRKVLWWDGETWLLHDRPDAHGLDESNRVTAWFELPEEDEDEEGET